MNRLVLSVLVIIGCVVSSFAQETIEVMRYEYEVTFKPEVSSDNVVTESLYLDVWDTYSRFYSKGYATRVENLAKPENSGLIGASISMANEGTDFEAVLVKDLYKLYYIQKLSGMIIKVESPLNQVKWRLIDGVEEYEGMKVQKAVGELSGRIWTVWFTADIPIIEGPYKFKNLPGFVVKAEDDKKDYSIEFRKSEKVQISLHFYEYEQADVYKASELVKVRNVKANMTVKQNLDAQGLRVNLPDTIENQQLMNRKSGDNKNYLEWLK